MIVGDADCGVKGMARKKKAVSSRPEKPSAGSSSTREKAASPEKPPSIKVTFSRSDGYRIFPATGIWGGVTPTGSVLANFMVQRPNEPESVILDWKDGAYEEVERVDKGSEIQHVRDLQCGILLGPNDAFLIGKWFIEKSLEAGYRQKKQLDDDDEKVK